MPYAFRGLFLKLLLCTLCLLPALSLLAQPTPPSTEERLQRLERKVAELDRSTRPIRQDNTFAAAGTLSFLFGAFCALWAQNTRRSPWLWFFLGLFFSVITVIVLLVKNSDRPRARR